MAPELEFQNIYNEYYPKILQYLTRMAGPNDAEDLAQDVFGKIHKSLDGFHGKSKLATWVYRVATNTAFDRSRSAAYQNAMKHVAMEGGADPEPDCVLEDHKPHSTDQLVIRKEMSDCIHEYIDKLLPDYKTVVVLSDLEGLSNKEIAEILDITLDNVKIRLHRARAKLKTVLNEACEFYYDEQNTLACDRKQVRDSV